MDRLKFGLFISTKKIDTLSHFLHPLESVTQTLYVPCSTPVMVEVVSPVSHTYEYGGIPPLGLTDALPSKQPGQEAGVVVRVLIIIGAPVTGTVNVLVQPDEVVTVTE